MILLDTNVVSEVMKAAPDETVGGWFAQQPEANVFVCAITEAELRGGVAIMPKGRRRDALTGLVEGVLGEDFADRNHPFDSPAAKAFAEIVADRRRAGRPISMPDAQIAAIAKSRGAALATRNVRDFEGCGVEVINPWESQR
jgi:predicted nucleic acid-binding protein